MAVVYLDPETEITGAVARLRAMPGGDVVVVVPAGSRVSTSRINFRLLAREARARDLRLAVVSDEPQVRALATAAGVSAHETVDAAEQALAALPASSSAEPETDLVALVQSTAVPADTGIRPPDAIHKPAEETMPFVRPPRAGGRLSVEPPLYDIREGGPAPRRRPAYRSWIAPTIAIALLLVLVGLGLYAAYLFVPTATVTLQPKLVDIGPLSMTVTADPRVTVVDAAAGLVPASELEIPVAATDTFAATGSDVTLTAASGSVRFSSKNTVFEVPVPAGTVVKTANGIEFETTKSVTVPRANFDTHKAGTVNVDVVARDRGPRGNVDAGAIKKLPASLSAALVSVRNPDATSGGSRTEEPVVTQADYDGAVAALTAALPAGLTVALTDPQNTPRGLTLYPATASLQPGDPDQPADALVDEHVESFTLTLNATAKVLAVNEDLVDQVAQEQLSALTPAGLTLLPETITTTHPPGEPQGNTIVFNASGVAKSWRSPDTDALLAEISGQSIGEARTIMEKYGSVDITVWPDFIDRLPDQNRIRLTVVPPQETV